MDFGGNWAAFEDYEVDAESLAQDFSDMSVIAQDIYSKMEQLRDMMVSSLFGMLLHVLGIVSRLSALNQRNTCSACKVIAVKGMFNPDLQEFKARAFTITFLVKLAPPLTQTKLPFFVNVSTVLSRLTLYIRNA